MPRTRFIRSLFVLFLCFRPRTYSDTHAPCIVKLFFEEKGSSIFILRFVSLAGAQNLDGALEHILISLFAHCCINEGNNIPYLGKRPHSVDTFHNMP